MRYEKKYTVEYKTAAAMELLREELTIGQISSKYGVHAMQLNQWKKAVVEGLPELLLDKRKKDQAAKEQEELINGLYAKIGELTTKLNWLKKI